MRLVHIVDVIEWGIQTWSSVTTWIAEYFKLVWQHFVLVRRDGLLIVHIATQRRCLADGVFFEGRESLFAQGQLVEFSTLISLATLLLQLWIAIVRVVILFTYTRASHSTQKWGPSIVLRLSTVKFIIVDIWASLLRVVLIELWFWRRRHLEARSIAFGGGVWSSGEAKPLCSGPSYPLLISLVLNHVHQLLQVIGLVIILRRGWEVPTVIASATVLVGRIWVISAASVRVTTKLT